MKSSSEGVPKHNWFSGVCSCGEPLEGSGAGRRVGQPRIAYCKKCETFSEEAKLRPYLSHLVAVSEPEFEQSCPFCLEGQLLVPFCNCNHLNAPCNECETGDFVCNKCDRTFSTPGKEPIMANQYSEAVKAGQLGLDLVAALQAQQGMTTVTVTLKNTSPALVYKKPVDMELAEADLVVVPYDAVPSGFVVARVLRVDDYARLEPGIHYRWVAAKLDLPDLAEIESKEDRTREALRAAEQRKQAEQAYKAALEAAGLSPEGLIDLLPVLGKPKSEG